eukprot:2967155-Pleurochrysis_carterae.AAC.2
MELADMLSQPDSLRSPERVVPCIWVECRGCACESASTRDATCFAVMHGRVLPLFFGCELEAFVAQLGTDGFQIVPSAVHTPNTVELRHWSYDAAALVSSVTSQHWPISKAALAAAVLPPPIVAPVPPPLSPPLPPTPTPQAPFMPAFQNWGVSASASQAPPLPFMPSAQVPALPALPSLPALPALPTLPALPAPTLPVAPPLSSNLLQLFSSPPFSHAPPHTDSCAASSTDSHASSLARSHASSQLSSAPTVQFGGPSSSRQPQQSQPSSASVDSLLADLDELESSLRQTERLLDEHRRSWRQWLTAFGEAVIHRNPALSQITADELVSQPERALHMAVLAAASASWDGRTDARADSRVDGRSEGRSEGRCDGRSDCRRASRESHSGRSGYTLKRSLDGADQRSLSGRGLDSAMSERSSERLGERLGERLSERRRQWLSNDGASADDGDESNAGSSSSAEPQGVSSD